MKWVAETIDVLLLSSAPQMHLTVLILFPVSRKFSGVSQDNIKMPGGRFCLLFLMQEELNKATQSLKDIQLLSVDLSTAYTYMWVWQFAN